MTLDTSGRPTVNGVDNLVENVRSALQQETPINIAAAFVLVLYD